MGTEDDIEHLESWCDSYLEEIKALKHDIERHVEITSRQADQIADLEAQLAHYKARVDLSNVTSLQTAIEAYWNANSPRQLQAAFHEVLLYGGKNGFGSGWRSDVARWLRKAALWVEGGM